MGQEIQKTKNEFERLKNVKICNTKKISCIWLPRKWSLEVSKQLSERSLMLVSSMGYCTDIGIPQIRIFTPEGESAPYIGRGLKVLVNEQCQRFVKNRLIETGKPIFS